MKLKITTDGTPEATEIVNTETGEHLENSCVAVNISILPEGVRAEVTLLAKDNLTFTGEFDVFKTKESICTPEALDKYLAKLKEYAESDDPEESHYMADESLCELLRELGCGVVVDAYEEVEKWYA